MRVWIQAALLAAVIGGGAFAQEPAPVPPAPAPPIPAPEPAPTPAPTPAPGPPAAGTKPAAGTAAKPATTGKEADAAKAKPLSEDKCPAWNVNSYRIGMTLEEATAVRPVTPDPKNERVRIVESETLKGRLTFNAANRLIRWDGELVGADPEAVRTAALEKWGVPRKTDTMGQLRKVRRKPWLFYMTVWQAPECDTRIVAEIGRYKGKPRKGPTTSVTVTLTVPPDNERKDEFKKQQGEDWLK